MNAWPLPATLELGMFGLRGPELLIIFAILFLLFGATRLPALGASLGSAIKNFKKGFGGADEEQPKGGQQASLSQGTPADKDVAAKTHSHQG